MVDPSVKLCVVFFCAFGLISQINAGVIDRNGVMWKGLDSIKDFLCSGGLSTDFTGMPLNKRRIVVAWYIENCKELLETQEDERPSVSEIPKSRPLRSMYTPIKFGEINRPKIGTYGLKKKISLGESGR